MSAISEKTDRLFMKASLSDEDLGYPDTVAFLASDAEWTDEVLWRNLTEGTPTVLVDDEVEFLLVPTARRLLDYIRGQVPVKVVYRAHGHATRYAMPSHLGRHPMQQMRELLASV